MKKTVYVNGNLAFPLQIGKRAVIQQGGDFIFTSLVVDISEERLDLARFETMNSIYEVSLAPISIEAAIPYPLGMVA